MIKRIEYTRLCTPLELDITRYQRRYFDDYLRALEVNLNTSEPTGEVLRIAALDLIRVMTGNGTKKLIVNIGHGGFFVASFVPDSDFLTKWIPVKSGLYPETDDYVLLSFANFSVPMVGRFEDGNFYIGDEDEPLLKQDIIVNAWMPLPERYKGDEEIKDE